MKNINNYLTKAAYAADANRPTNKSTVSNVDDGTGVIYEGKNVLVDKPAAGIGDICVYNTSVSAVQFIKFGTYNVATLPSSITILGVVYYRTENRVNIVSKNNQASARWAEGYKVKLAGFDFVNGGSFTITVNATTTAPITYTSTDTLTTIATAIAAALTNAGFTSATGWTITANNVNNCIAIVRHYYTPAITTFSVTDAATKVIATIITPKDYQSTTSGLLTVYAGAIRKDGVVSWVGACFDKFYSYYYTSGGTDTNQSVGASSVINYATFSGGSNPLLTAYYGTGIAGYTVYLQDKMVKYPYSKNAIIDDDGNLNTTKLSTVTYVDIDGTNKYAYPAANIAKYYGITVSGFTTGLEAGAWWLPSFREMYLLIKNVLLNNLDAVNRSLTAIGGDNVLASGYYPWTSAEFSSNSAWYYNGYYGSMLNNTKNNTYAVRPVTAF